MYQLVDFGNARKLELFSGFLIDRPSPAATGQPLTDQWNQADGRFEIQENHKGRWSWKRRPEDWKVDTPFGAMELFPNDFGHLGVFMEQANQWEWLTQHKHLRAIATTSYFAKREDNINSCLAALIRSY